mgnify:CR=1 FL=1
MSAQVRRILLWAPRKLGILFALFIALFAFDVFGQGYGMWGSIAAFLIHLIPTGLILIAVAVAWRWEWLGGLLFTALGMTYVVSAWGKFGWTAYLVVAGPCFLIAALFLVSWWLRGKPSECK